MSDHEASPPPEPSQPPPPAAPKQPWASPEAMILGAVSAVGLLAFAVVYALVLDRGAASPVAGGAGLAPQAAVQAMPGSAPGPARAGLRGEPGPRGEAGPPGPPGDPGIRIVRHNCSASSCTVKCDADEVMLTAHCGVGRLPAVYPTEQTALCRTTTTARVDVVGACVKTSPR